MIQAIETKYNGYKFRSRLEARWAVFFDKMDIEYTYEPESFMSDYKFELKGRKACYLPDFYLPKLNMWVEVKGDKNKLFDDSARMACILSDLLKKHQGIILLGNVPDGNNIAHNVIYFEKGYLKSSKCFFENNYIKRIQNEEVVSKKYLTDINNDYGNFFNCDHSEVNIKIDKKVMLSYKNARSARFEFGDTPKAKYKEVSPSDKKPSLSNKVKEDKNDKELISMFEKYRNSDFLSDILYIFSGEKLDYKMAKKMSSPFTYDLMNIIYCSGEDRYTELITKYLDNNKDEAQVKRCLQIMENKLHFEKVAQGSILSGVERKLKWRHRHYYLSSRREISLREDRFIDFRYNKKQGLLIYKKDHGFYSQSKGFVAASCAYVYNFNTIKYIDEKIHNPNDPRYGCEIIETELVKESLCVEGDYDKELHRLYKIDFGENYI